MIIRFVKISKSNPRIIALHKLCAILPGPGDSINVTTDGGDVLVAGKEAIADLYAAVEQYEKDSAPRPVGRPPLETGKEDKTGKVKGLSAGE